MKKLMYFTGYTTSVTRNGNFIQIQQNPKNLIPGKRYLVKKFSYESTRNGNGGSSYSSVESAFKVYDMKTNNILSENERISVFQESIPKKCSHEEMTFVNEHSDIQQCNSCFKKFKVTKVLRSVK